MAARFDRQILYRVLGLRIAEARQQVGWSQTKLAGKAGLSRGSIANIEQAKQHPPLHSIWSIALALGLEPRQLIPTTDELTPEQRPAELDSRPIDEKPRVRRLLDDLGPDSRSFVRIAKSEGSPPPRKGPTHEEPGQ